MKAGTPRFIRPLPALALLFCLMSVLSGNCGAQTIEERYGVIRETYRSTFAMQEPERKADTLRRCIRQLGEILGSDSEMKVADRCLYLIGQCHHHLFDQGKDPRDLEAALEAYRKLVEQQPNSPLADDAQYLKGVVLMTDNPQQAFIEFRKVALFFPRGDSRTKANQMMEQLRRESGCKDLKEPDLPNQVSISGKESRIDPHPAKPVPPVSRERTPEASSFSPAPSPGPPPCPSVAELQRIQAWSGESYTRVALYTSGPVTFEEQSSESGSSLQISSQILISLRGCVVNPKMDTQLKTSDPFLEGVSAKQADNNITQVVLDARSIERYRIFTLSDPHRVIIDVQGMKSFQQPPPPPPH